MADDVVITGMGIVSPIGCGEAAFWDALRQGRSGAGPVEGLDTSQLTRKIACQVREPIDVEHKERSSDDELSPPPLKRRATQQRGGTPLGRASQLAVAASREAVRDAGVVPAALREQRTAVIIGTTMGETDFIEERLSAPESEWLSPDHMKWIVSGRPGCIARNVQADLLSSSRLPESAGDETGARGSAQAPDRSGFHSACGSGMSCGSGVARGSAMACCSAIDLYGACAAGNMAIAKARRQLLEDRCDMVLAGGSDGFSRLAFIGFMRLRAMAAEVCRPFDEKRDGLLVGEGAAMFVLERESSAKARGAPIRARVKGASITCEDYHPTRPHPEGDGLTRAIQEALRDAGMSPSDVDYVCAHGTGTPHNDAIEVKVMENCFPEGVSFSSIKALTGHTMGAAAAMETACCVLSLQHQELIPTWHLDNVLQPCALDAIQGAVRPARVRCVVNNSVGFGGYNASIILTIA